MRALMRICEGRTAQKYAKKILGYAWDSWPVHLSSMQPDLRPTSAFPQKMSYLE